MIPTILDISTALVLHGVVISFLGPINSPNNLSLLRYFELLSNHESLLISSFESMFLCSITKKNDGDFLKNDIIIISKKQKYIFLYDYQSEVKKLTYVKHF